MSPDNVIGYTKSEDRHGLLTHFSISQVGAIITARRFARKVTFKRIGVKVLNLKDKDKLKRGYNYLKSMACRTRLPHSHPWTSLNVSLGAAHFPQLSTIAIITRLTKYPVWGQHFTVAPPPIPPFYTFNSWMLSCNPANRLPRPHSSKSPWRTWANYRPNDRFFFFFDCNLVEKKENKDPPRACSSPLHPKVVCRL